MLTTFIEQNKRKDMELKKEEDEREDRSIKKIKKKEPIWNSTLHRIEYFGGPLIDLHHQFIKPKNIKYTINPNSIDVYGLINKNIIDKENIRKS